MSVMDYILVLGDLYIPDRAIEIPKEFRARISTPLIQHVVCLGNLTDIETFKYLKGLTPDFRMVPGAYDLPSTFRPVVGSGSGGGSGSLLSSGPNAASAPSASTSASGTGSTSASHAPSSSNHNPASPNPATTTATAPTSTANPTSVTFSQTSGIITQGDLRIGYVNGTTIIPQGDPDSLLIAARQMDADVLLWGGTHQFDAYECDGKFFINPGSATGAFSTARWAPGHEPVPSFVLLDVQGSVLTGYVYSLKEGENGQEGEIVSKKFTFRKGGDS